MHGRYFVYYRVPEDRLDEAVAALRRVHAALGSQIELLRRPGASQGLVTLMDVYELDDATAAAFEDRAAAALAPWLDGQRHVERFESAA